MTDLPPSGRPDPKQFRVARISNHSLQLLKDLEHTYMEMADAKTKEDISTAFTRLSYIRQSWVEWIEHLEQRAEVKAHHIVRFI